MSPLTTALIACLVVGRTVVAADGETNVATAGPLHVHPDNPRYFATASGRAIYLTGSHTWASVQERRYPETPELDYQAFLDFLARHGHNLTRLWAWEHAAWMQFSDRKIVYYPHPWPRTGPGKALDGLPKFDLSRSNDAYFQRLRERVVEAGKRGIYCMVMLFQGFSIEQKRSRGALDPRKGNPWRGHPLNAANNINGIDGDANQNGEGEEVHTLAVPAVTALQEAYVRRVVTTLNDLDNVIWEIANESHGGSIHWQYHMIEFIREVERELPQQHPVAMTYQWGGARSGTNRDLLRSLADAISPNRAGGFRDDPPAEYQGKVIISDTDHLWGIGGTAEWVWKSFLRGHNPIFMDPYLDARTGGRLDPRWDPVRIAMGQTRRYAERLDLGRTFPHPELAGTGYCLAEPGVRYLVYLSDGGGTTLDLRDADGRFQCEWFDPRGDRVSGREAVEGGAVRTLSAPHKGPAVALVTRE